MRLPVKLKKNGSSSAAPAENRYFPAKLLGHIRRIFNDNNPIFYVNS